MRLSRARTTQAGAFASTRFVPAPHVVAVVHGTDTALLDMRAERYYTLDEVGTRVWTLLGEGAPVDVIVRRLLDEFDAPAATIEGDLRALLDQLHSARLIAAAVQRDS